MDPAQTDQELEDDELCEEEAESAGEKLETWALAASEKVGLGVLAGFAASVFCRRRWPIVLGLGLGSGQSLGDFPVQLRQEAEAAAGPDQAPCDLEEDEGGENCNEE